MIFISGHGQRLRIGNSTIHGKGLFALDRIQEGTILGKVRGIRTFRDGAYVLWISETMGVRMLCKYKYINHSDEPNIILYDNLEVCALRDILPGEEITHDYSCGE